LALASRPGLGSEVKLFLPRCAPPGWWVSFISLTPGMKVFVLDDDPSIHSVWDHRFKEAASGLELIHFSNPNDLREYYRKHYADLEKALFLVDYEIHGQGKSGLEVIEELGLQEQSILVTSRFEDYRVQQAVLRAGVRMLPKQMSGMVPLK
jgi:hypothetical protein